LIWGLLKWLFEMFDFLVLCVLGVIFEFLKFSKMSFLILFNSNYSLFSKLFLFEASLSDFLKCLTFWFWGVFGVIVEFLNFFENAILNIFQFWPECVFWLLFIFNLLLGVLDKQTDRQTDKQTDRQTFQNTDSAKGWVKIHVIAK